MPGSCQPACELWPGIHTPSCLLSLVYDCMGPGKDQLHLLNFPSFRERLVVSSWPFLSSSPVLSGSRRRSGRCSSSSVPPPSTPSAHRGGIHARRFRLLFEWKRVPQLQLHRRRATVPHLAPPAVRWRALAPTPSFQCRCGCVPLSVPGAPDVHGWQFLTCNRDATWRWPTTCTRTLVVTMVWFHPSRPPRFHVLVSTWPMDSSTSHGMSHVRRRWEENR
mmetsp:Transcript_1478/g.9019  ORF Transcript_1478/g.9019 Transcript_1478/m.9019 type:complete len:220 (-) Transcript_1478:2596-3255(-)